VNKTPAILEAIAKGEASLRVIENAGEYPLPYSVLMANRRAEFVTDAAWAFATAVLDQQQRREHEFAASNVLRFTLRNSEERVHFRPSLIPLYVNPKALL
jgi:hypothetical protein